MVLVTVNIILAGTLAYRAAVRGKREDSGLPAGHPDVSIPRALGLDISGTVKVSAKFRDRWPAGAHVFIIARGENGGPPYAVRRYDAPKVPFDFNLSSENIMIAGAAAPDALMVSARVDQDGNPLARQLGDLESDAIKTTDFQAKIDLVVDRETPLRN